MSRSTSDSSTPDLDRWARLAVEAPRYTSYPTAAELSPSFGPADAERVLVVAAARPSAPVSIYVHLPFCREMCWFCGCHALVARTADRIDRYLDALERETDRVAARLGNRRDVAELHFGGGSPSLLTPAQFERLWSSLSGRLRIRAETEASIEVDPRTVDPARMAAYRGAGIQRVSMGFQDLDAGVQAAIGRNQSAATSVRAYEWARAAGFGGVNIDLCYGLPEQTEQSFEDTVREVARLRPDRLALFGYAHVPAMKPLQARIDTATLPDAARRVRLFTAGRNLLLAAGYRAIGIDHFALPGDPLVRALDAGRLHRNFQGYTTSTTDTLVGLGLSAISDFGDAVVQNQRTLPGYLAAVDSGALATERGFVRSADDRVRGEIIRQLMCTFAVDVPDIERRFGVAFARDFAPELAELARLADDGLLTIAPERLDLSPLGKMLARNVATVFDAYRRRQGSAVEPHARRRFSLTV